MILIMGLPRCLRGRGFSGSRGRAGAQGARLFESAVLLLGSWMWSALEHIGGTHGDVKLCENAVSVIARSVSDEAIQ